MRNPKLAIKNRQQPILIATQSFFSPVLKTRQRGQKGSSHNQKKKKKTLSFLCRSRTETDRQKEDRQKNMQGGELRASPAMSHFWDFQILGFSITGFCFRQATSNSVAKPHGAIHKWFWVQIPLPMKTCPFFSLTISSSLNPDL
jgi:hypothetical protein